MCIFSLETSDRCPSCREFYKGKAMEALLKEQDKKDKEGKEDKRERSNTSTHRGAPSNVRMC